MQELRWIDFPDETLVVNGLWWFAENSPELWRLPGRLRGTVRPEVWELALQPSGGRVRFASDTTAVAIRVRYGSIELGHNFSRIGQAGFALYADGRFLRPAFPEEPGESELMLFENAPRKMRQLTLYLPLYHPVQLLAVGIDRDAEVKPPKSFSVGRPVAFYGSSITQGGCASQAGMSYQAILGRMLEVDFVNLGFSGEGRGEPELAEAFAEIDAPCFVVAFAQNCPTVDELAARYAPFLETIRRAHSETPIICITPIYSSLEALEGERLSQNAAKREVIRAAFADRKKAGDRGISLVEGLKLLGESEAEFTCDGSHPNDLGFHKMAERLAPALCRALKLKVPRGKT
ncbi:MAG: SGNH/GDSL hydrolase family protein [Planctomycetota bacterium]|jgi:hypothetical protein